MLENTIYFFVGFFLAVGLCYMAWESNKFTVQESLSKSFMEQLQRANNRNEYMEGLFIFACDRIEDPKVRMEVMNSRKMASSF